jgi:hypothetical protein
MNKTTIDMAREAWEQSGEGWVHPDWFEDRAKALKAFEALVRADEREQGQKWFDAVTAQHKQLILAEREACAKVCDARYMGDNNREDMEAKRCAAAIRARGNT